MVLFLRLRPAEQSFPAYCFYFQHRCNLACDTCPRAGETPDTGAAAARPETAVAQMEVNTAADMGNQKFETQDAADRLASVLASDPELVGIDPERVSDWNGISPAPQGKASSGIEIDPSKQPNVFTQMLTEQTGQTIGGQQIGETDALPSSYSKSGDADGWHTGNELPAGWRTQKTPGSGGNLIDGLSSAQTLKMTGTDGLPAGSAEVFASILPDGQKNSGAISNENMPNTGKTKQDTSDTMDTFPAFKAGELFEDSIEVNGIHVSLLAETEIDGDTVTLKNIAIYSDQGDVPNQIGSEVFFAWRRKLRKAGKQQKFKLIKGEGIRVPNSSSVNPGHEINFTIKIKE